jgi:hypothetical protein
VLPARLSLDVPQRKCPHFRKGIFPSLLVDY